MPSALGHQPACRPLCIKAASGLQAQVHAVRCFATSQGVSCCRQLLHVKVLAARGFVEYVARQPLPGEQLALHGELCGQRFQSAPAAAAAEPNLTVEAYIELPAANSTVDGPSSSSSEGKDTVTHTGALAGGATAAAQVGLNGRVNVPHCSWVKQYAAHLRVSQ